ncbi:21423_t:CDS:2 [Gigaspora rosea]|nr:21423_t:CDS:2 [Gigaspora rosea]
MSSSNEITNLQKKSCSGCGKSQIELQDKPLDNEDTDVDNWESINNKLLYEVCDFEELININFKHREVNNSKVEFSIMIKLKMNYLVVKCCHQN